MFMLPPDTVDKVKKEYDSFKFAKEQEIQELKRKVCVDVAIHCRTNCNWCDSVRAVFKL